jgi:hypothetical protein
MGTRSTVKFFSQHDQDQPLASIYQQWDGYITGVGHDLADFLKDKKIINGIQLHQTAIGNEEYTFEDVINVLQLDFEAKPSTPNDRKWIERLHSIMLSNKVLRLYVDNTELIDFTNPDDYADIINNRIGFYAGNCTWNIYTDPAVNYTVQTTNELPAPNCFQNMFMFLANITTGEYWTVLIGSHTTNEITFSNPDGETLPAAPGTYDPADFYYCIFGFDCKAQVQEINTLASPFNKFGYNEHAPFGGLSLTLKQYKDN